MSSRFSKRQTIIFIILLSLAFILPFTLFLVKQRQEVRKKAAGTEVLQLKLEPENVTKNHGDSINYTVKLTNTTSSPVQIRVVGVEFAVKPRIDDFEISQINCGSSLSSKAFGDVFEGKIRLVCYKPPGSTGPSEPLTIPAAGQIGSTIDVGSFQIIIKPSATGVYRLSSKEVDGGRNNIPQETTLVDLSNIGAEASITITDTPTGTITPTQTPTPTSTPTPPHTPTPTTTPNTASLTFKIKFQLITSSRSRKLNKNVRVILKQGGIEKYREVIEVTSDQNAVYSGTLVNITPGTYDILIKGWAHLQKKFQNITLNEGENVMDWSGTPLIVGDTYGNDLGDNKIQMEDVTAVIANWIQNSTPVTSTNLRYDLDDNGFIQIEDVTAVIANWTEYIRRGEE